MAAPVYGQPHDVRGIADLSTALEKIQSNFERLFKGLSGIHFEHGILPAPQTESPRYVEFDGTDVVWAKVDLTNGVEDGPLVATLGGTGLTSFVVGDILYASSTTALNRLADVALGAVLRSGGVGAAPAYTAAGTADQVLRIPGAGGSPAFGQVDLAKTAAVTGILDEANGGTGNASYATGDLLYASSASVLSRLPIAASVTGVLRSTGTLPAWTAWGIAATFTQGDILYAFTNNNIQALAKGTIGKVIRAGASLPAYSTFTIPDTFAANDMIYASGANVLAALTAAASRVLTTSAGSVPQWSANLPYGNLPTGGGTWVLGGNLTLSGGHLLFSADDTYDIGALGATRPNNIYMGGFIDMLAITNPAAPAAGVVRFHALTTQGFSRVEQDNEAATNLTLARDNVFIARNTSGSDIAAGKCVYISGSTGNIPNIALAKADSLTTMPAMGITLDAITNNLYGQVMDLGILASLDTSAFSTGDRLYVSAATAGALTATRPTVPNYAQRIGSVLVSNAGTGSIKIAIAPFLGNEETGTNAASWTIQAGHILFGTDATYDIGASGATRPKDLHLSGVIKLGGGQISFPATAALSTDVNTLDDYEEGSWTPVVTAVTPGDLTIVYSTQVGRYTRIGNTVFVKFNIVTSTFTHSTASGNLFVTGLPFTSENVTGSDSGGSMIVSGFTFPAGYTNFVSRISPNANYIDCLRQGSGVTNAGIAVSDTVSGTNIQLGTFVTYRVATS